MSSPNPFFKSIRESSGIRLAVLFGSFFILLLISSSVTLLIDGCGKGNERTHMLWGSVVQCLLAFCFPALILGIFCSKHGLNWLKLTNVPHLKSLIGVIIIYLLSMPAMEWLIDWNSSLHLPESLSSLETMLRDWETAGEESTKVLLDTHGWLPMLGGVFVIGILTGFSEELFFRGGLQGILIRSSIGKNCSIWLTAFIFSAMHFQFFGFLPRLLMGAFFGYLLFWTRSIWVPVFAHVLNNSVVVVTSAFKDEYSTAILNSQTVSDYNGISWMVIISGILTIGFLILCKDSLFKIKSKNSFGPLWQKKQRPPVSEI